MSSMSAPDNFGRRQPAIAPPAKGSRRGAASGPTPAAKSSTRPPAASDLGPRAEALRVQIAADRRATPSAFDQWRRSQGGQRWLVWAVTLASFSPGLISFIFNAPLLLSIGLEVAAFAGNIWLRRQRRRRMREIVAWQDPAELRRR
jgi:hypothetical protein